MDYEERHSESLRSVVLMTIKTHCDVPIAEREMTSKCSLQARRKPKNIINEKCSQ